MKDFINAIKLEFIPIKETSNSSGRLLYIDVLKIIAAFLTVFYHLAYYKFDYGFVSGQVYAPNINRIVMCLAACCVPLYLFFRFYIISYRFNKDFRCSGYYFIWYNNTLGYFSAHRCFYYV